ALRDERLARSAARGGLRPRRWKAARVVGESCRARSIMEFSESLQKYFRLGPRQLRGLEHLNIITIRDLLFYFPRHYEEFVGEKHIVDLKAGERASIACSVVKIKSQKTWKTRINLAEAVVKDETGLLRVVWFNQPYVVKMLPEGAAVRLTGRIAENKKGLYLANPVFEFVTEKHSPLPYEESSVGKLQPIYPETRGVSSRWLQAHIKKIIENTPPSPETLPEEILKHYHLPGVMRALKAIHFPKTLEEAGAARKRFSFEEIFAVQLARQRDRKKLAEYSGFRIEPAAGLIKEFFASLPYELTEAQKRALGDILNDFKKPHPMARLLEGDVGSGKTVVAAAAALAAVKAGFQVAFMAPTEILALQHFEELKNRLAIFRVPLGLLTSSESRKFPSKVNPKSSTKISKNQLLKWVASGDIKVLIGTHSLIEDRVKFKKLGFVIVDEQHRFGTEQRHRALKINSGGQIPHFLSMSATPIPRTLALTLYADLDLSLIDEMPPERKPVETKIVFAHDRLATYEFIRREVRRGGQVFVVCPKIEEKNPDTNYQLQTAIYQPRMAWDDVKSVKAEYKKLAEHVFPDLKIGMLHGKLTPKEKEATMKRFREGELDILVSTSVIEVGVDIPGASIMMIEGGERFGLATLHQFRGRVGRRGQNAYCFIFTTDGGNLKRLKALEKAKSGFELAEYDLEFRGPGELSGAKQWGFSDIGMEALKNMKMVEAARKEAEAIINDDPELKKYPLLKERLGSFKRIHFE
ncbi:MAG: ATP-dependent DNA helicase RecG, partial [Candidatus Sungiibacteriota bacterium]